MRSKFLQTVKETFFSSLPLAIIIVICLCIAPLPTFSDYLKIVVGYVCVVIGQAMFLVGPETSILPIGRMVGGSFAQYNKLAFVLSFGFVFGLLATVAEPALSVLAKQISAIMPLVNSTLFIRITDGIKKDMGVGTPAHGLCFFLPVEMSTLTLHEQALEE